MRPEDLYGLLQMNGFYKPRILENQKQLKIEIENTAYIFFDWNDPIVTNTTYNINVIGSEGLTDNNATNVQVFPNPSSESITISCEGNFDYQLVDLSGRIISSGTGTDSENISISNAAVGIYQLNVQTKQGNSSLKVMKQ